MRKVGTSTLRLGASETRSAKIFNKVSELMKSS